MAEGEISDHRVRTTLETARREDRLRFAFQPVISATTGAIEYYECLLRLRGDDGEIIDAGAFVGEVERFGLAGTFDRMVLEKAIEELAVHPEIRLGFNISGLTAANRDWLGGFLAAARDRNLLMRRIVIEITETAALSDLDEAARFVGALRGAGCRIALDDFGAGHTSLRCLQSLAVHMVKIDGSFVQGLTIDRDSQVFLRHLLGLTDSLGLATIAESVENAEQVALLRDAGVNFLQGHYCGAPTNHRPWSPEAKPS
jgi:EAL domain-containing protein (putative c-di-GMP-specific phosphodiesterase class I)